MPSWTHLVRFVALEDNQVHLGQIVDTAQDIGLQSVSKTEIKVYEIEGDVFDGKVTDNILTVHHVSLGPDPTFPRP